TTVSKEAHIIFKDVDEHRFAGNGGCNNISGTYELKMPNKIAIGNIISTKMACPNMELESQFLKALSEADNYSVTEEVLIMNTASFQPLAKFRAVYMK